MKFLTIFLSLCAFASARTLDSRLSSRIVTRGEVQLFQILIPAQINSDMPPAPPTAKGVQIEPKSANLAFSANGPVTILNYQISSYDVGIHTIPAFSFQIGQEMCTTAPQTIRVFAQEELKWTRAEVGDGFSYAAQIFPLKTNLVEGEASPVEVKIYYPSSIQCGQWALPNIPKGKADLWEFNLNPLAGSATLLGNAYSVMTFSSTVQTNQSGKISLGPGSISSKAFMQVTENGYYQQRIVPLKFEVAASEITCRALPAGAPPAFRNAIGNFTIEARASQTEIRDGDPIQVTLTVTGSGNLAAIQPPQPENPELWKVYQGNSQQTNPQNTDANIRIFTQTIRATGKTPPEIPAFTLTYFDPTLGQYQVAKSKPIPLTILPSLTNDTPPSTVTPNLAPNAAQPSNPTVVKPNPQAMTDILGPIAQTREKSSPPTHILPFVHAILALITLALIAKISLKKRNAWRTKNADLIARRNELKSLSKTNFPSDTEFLRAAASFASRHHLPESDPDVQELFAQRDSHCYRPDSSPSPTTAAPLPREKFLRALRRLSLIAFAAFLTTPRADAQTSLSPSPMTSYQQQNFSRAAQSWLQSAPYQDLSADTLYNIGTAAYHDHKPGLAALYFQRALVKNPHHPEATQNLHFLRQKLGSFDIPQTPTQTYLAKLPIPTWQTLAQLSAWLLGIAILSLFAFTKPHKITHFTVIAAATLLLATSLTALLLSPLIPQNLPPEQQLITLEESPLFTNASAASPTLTKIPTGTACKIIRRTGSWTHIAIGTTRGWLPTSTTQPLIPNQTPQDFQTPQP